MTILITLTTIGVDCSTFDIYSNIDGFTSAFETDVPKASLSAGFSSSNVPDSTSTIRIKAKGLCSNYIDLNLDGSTTTTTTSSTSSTTTTTTTIAPTSECLLYSMTTNPTNIPIDLSIRYRDCTTNTINDTLINSLIADDNLDGTYTYYVCVKQNGIYSSPVFVQNNMEVVHSYVWTIDSECSPIV